MDVNEELKFVKIKKIGGGVGSGGSGWGVRVGVNEELKLLKMPKQIGGVGGQVRPGIGGLEGWGLVKGDGVGW